MHTDSILPTSDHNVSMYVSHVSGHSVPNYPGFTQPLGVRTAAPITTISASHGLLVL